MIKTASGIDDFKISWQSFTEKNDGWLLEEVKPNNEPLQSFFERKKDY